MDYGVVIDPSTSALEENLAGWRRMQAPRPCGIRRSPEHGHGFNWFSHIYYAAMFYALDFFPAARLEKRSAKARNFRAISLPDIGTP